MDYEFYHDDKCFYLISEFCQNGDMFDRIHYVNGPFHEFTAAHIIYQILSAILYCHSHSIVHRDIKPENIMIDKDLNIKLIDFGTACKFNPEEGMQHVIGTLMYMAPEVLKKESVYNQSSDMWSIGILMYVMLTGIFPYSNLDNRKAIIEQILLGKYD